MAAEHDRGLSDAQAAELGARVARALLREHGGWGAALRAARAEGLGPLVSLAVEHGRLSPPDHIAGAIGRTLGKAGRLQRLAAVAFQEGALAVLRELEEAGVTCAAIKGFATAPLYGMIHLRLMADVDLLTREADLSRVEAVLARRGYRAAKRDAIEVSFEPPPAAGPGRRTFLPPVDVHVRLSYEGQFDLDVGGMLSRATRLDSIPVLAPEDAVLVACSDAARDCFAHTGRAVADVAVLAATARVDWDAVAARARAWGMSGAAWVALSCARRTLGAPVSEAAVRRLAPSVPLAAYLRLWLDTRRLSPWRLTCRVASASDLRFPMAVLWPVLVDGAWRRGAFVAKYAASRLRPRAPRGGRPAP